MSRRWTQEEYAAHLCRSHASVASETPSGRIERLHPLARTSARPLKVGRRTERLEGLPLLRWQLEQTCAQPPETEYRFHAERQWRADLCWPEAMLIMEYEGAVHMQGRHTRGEGFERDVEKYNAAVLLGFRLLRATWRTVESGEALKTTLQALKK